MDQTGTGSNMTSSGNTDTRAASARVVDDTASRAHDKIDRAAATARPAVDRLAANAHNLVERAATSASDAAEGIDSKVDDFRATGARFADQCESYVQENPMKAIGFGCGLW